MQCPTRTTNETPACGVDKRHVKENNGRRDKEAGSEHSDLCGHTDQQIDPQGPE